MGRICMAGARRSTELWSGAAMARAQTMQTSNPGVGLTFFTVNGLQGPGVRRLCVSGSLHAVCSKNHDHETGESVTSSGRQLQVLFSRCVAN